MRISRQTILCARELEGGDAIDYASCMIALPSNIQALRRHLGLNQAAFGERIGVGQASVSKWESGSDEPGARPIGKMAELAGVSVDDFYDKQWRPRDSQPVVMPDIPPTIRLAPEGGVVEIGALDLSVSMGPGTLLDEWVEAEPVKFDEGFLRSITRSPFTRLKLIEGIGDSMFPTLVDRDRILIDTTQKSLSRQDGVYWISVYGAANIKRLRAVGPSRIMIISDNPAVDNYEVDAEDLRIEGRAIWFARGL